MFADMTRKQNPKVAPQIPCIQLGGLQYGGLLIKTTAQQ